MITKSLEILNMTSHEVIFQMLVISTCIHLAIVIVIISEEVIIFFLLCFFLILLLLFFLNLLLILSLIFSLLFLCNHFQILLIVFFEVRVRLRLRLHDGLHHLLILLYIDVLHLLVILETHRASLHVIRFE